MNFDLDEDDRRVMRRQFNSNICTAAIALIVIGLVGLLCYLLGLSVGSSGT